MKTDFFKTGRVRLEKYYANLLDNQKQRLKNYISLILTLLLVSLLGLLAINPTLSTISNLQKQYEDNKFIEEALDKKINSLSILSAKYSALKPSLEYLYLAIPTNAKIPNLARQIEKIVGQNNLILKNFGVGTIELYPIINKVSTDDFYSFSFNLSVEGSETDVNNFLSNVIYFDRIINVEQISIAKKDKNIYGLSLKGKAYFEK